MICIPATIVGIPLWAVGGSGKAKAELTLQNINIVPENSMAVSFLPGLRKEETFKFNPVRINKLTLAQKRLNFDS